jgi:hypothetical protein
MCEYRRVKPGNDSYWMDGSRYTTASARRRTLSRSDARKR